MANLGCQFDTPEIEFELPPPDQSVGTVFGGTFLRDQPTVRLD